MANPNAPKGFSPVRTKNAASFNEQANLYYIPSTDTSAYGIGSAVKSGGDADANGVPSIALATGTDTLRGVIVGFVVDPTDLTALSIPATKSKDYYAYVVDDPSTVFEIQCDNTAITSADMGLNASFTVGAPSATTSAYATSVLSGSTLATTQALNLKVVGVAQNQDTTFGAYSVLRVIINQHELAGNTAGL